MLHLAGLRTMPPTQVLVGGLLTCGVDTAERYEERPAETQAQAVMANTLLQVQVAQPGLPEGVYIGEGVVPIPRKLAEKIWRWEFMDMDELLRDHRGGEIGTSSSEVVADIYSVSHHMSASKAHSIQRPFRN